ncbi:MAG: EAL domain-containing protein [Firmicutes bacterium]|nr:EAL domain-containing protein [Bacillota bacterium]
MFTSERSLGKKLIFFTTVLLIFASLSIGLSSYMVARDALIEKGKISLKNGVKSALQLIDEMQIHVADGCMTTEEAQNRAKLLLMGPLDNDGTRKNENEQDFGEHGYYIIYSREGVEIMHPTLEGQNVINFVDKGFGKSDFYLVKDKIEKAENGGGYTEYTWEYPYSQKLGKKVVYSELDSDWGWVVTAGSYISDFNRAASIIVYITFMTIIIIVLIGYYLTKLFMLRITRPITEVVKGLKDAENENYHPVEEVNSNDELKNLTHGFNSMIFAMEAAQKNLIKKDDQLLQYAYYDQLSGLPNAYFFKISVQPRLKSMKTSCALLLIDIKDFNLINSIYGNAFGDRVIEQIGQIVTREKPYNTIIARVGGNEFAMWVEDVDDSQIEYELIGYLSYLKKELSYLNVIHHFDFYMSMVSVKPQHNNDDFDEVYKRAHAALEYSKKYKVMHLNRYHTSMTAALERESKILQHAEQAIKEKAFNVVFQSKVDLESQKVVGVEALARWEIPELGVIRPDEFVPLIVHANLMAPFTKIIIEKSFECIPRFRRLYGEDVTLSINLPPTLFFDNDFMADLKCYLEKWEIKPGTVYLEITEDIFVGDFSIIESRLESIRQMGMCISLDDFGTGYSSLNYLAHMKFDEIKIDKSFIDPITNSDTALALFKSIVAISKALKCEVVAEGVEDMAQVDIIRSNGCRFVQGYVYSKPLSIDDHEMSKH